MQCIMLSELSASKLLAGLMLAVKHSAPTGHSSHDLDQFYLSHNKSTCIQYLYAILKMCVLIEKLLNHHLLFAAVQHCHVHFIYNDCKLSMINFHCLIYD